MKMCVFLLIVSVILAAPISWKHPGVLVGEGQLARMLEQVHAKSGPAFVAFQKATASSVASLTYKAKGPPASGTIECGSYSHPNYGCADEDHDGAAAYLQLLLFNATGTAQYAENAVAILNEYGARLRKYNNSNAPLQAAWGASKWTRAAELAKHLTGVHWVESDQKRFSDMLYRVALPLIYKGSHANGNWELSMIEGMIGLAVFSENSTLFEHAVQFWKERVPAYFYNFKEDGGHHKPAPRGSPSWYGQTTFDASTSGVCQETCRDLGHTMYGVAASSNIAATASIQSVDLFQLEGERMSLAFEFNANLALGASVPKDVCGGKVDVRHLPTFEVAYAYLSKSHSMPKTLEYISKVVRTQTDPQDDHMAIYETLSHAK